MEATSLRFAAAARLIGDTARARGLTAPAFASPPRVPGAQRTLRRRRGGHVTVAVQLRGRPWAAVLADMIDGVVAVNGLRGLPADALRRALWAAVEGEVAQAA
jgi:hypothetical protein